MSLQKKTPSDSLVVKDNKLINARYSLSVAEMRLFLLMVAQVRREDKDFTTYRIKISDFMDKLETNSKSIYERAREMSKKLMEKVLEIEEPDGKLQIALLSSAKYYSGKGFVELRFDPALKPYLLQLKEKFTSYDIRYVLKLQSSHSIRIYELLKQYERIGERTLGVEELKGILGLEGKYRSYNYFKKRVIQQAEMELKLKCDIWFEFTEIKEGRRVEKIHFNIHKQQKQVNGGKKASSSDLSLEESLVEMGLSHRLAKQFLEKLEEKEIRQAILYTQKQFSSGKIKSNVGGYLKKILESGGISVSKLEKEKAQQREVKSHSREIEERLKELEDRFDELRRQEIDVLVAKAEDKEWMEFEGWAKENVYVKNKVFENGELQKSREDAQFWFRSFLSDRLPNKNDAFIKWVYEETGYQVRLSRDHNGEKFVIDGKQENLFSE